MGPKSTNGGESDGVGRCVRICAEVQFGVHRTHNKPKSTPAYSHENP